MYLAVFTFVLGLTGCSSDDDGGGPDSIECAGITYTRGDNGNAIDEDGTDTGQNFDDFVTLANSGLCDIQIGF